MKSYTLTLSLLLTAVSILSAVPILALADTEPNNDFDSAEDLSLDTTVQGSVDYDDYTDMYKVTVPAPAAGKVKSITVTLEFNSANDFDLYVLDEHQSTVAWSATYDAPESCTFQSDNGGLYYIDIEDWSGSGSYNLTTTSSDITGDSDNQMETATEVSSGNTKTGSINGDTDMNDYFKIQLHTTANTADKLNVTLTAANPSNKIIARLYNSTMDMQTSGVTNYNNGYGSVTGPTIYLEAVADTDGYYYIQLNGVLGGGSYTIRFMVTQVQSDGNNNQGDAAQLNDGVAHTETLNMDTDSVDWYYIDVPDPGAGKAPIIHVNLTTTALTQPEIDISVYNTTNKDIGDGYLYWDKTTEFSALGDVGGKYTIKVSLSDGNGDVPYSIKVWTTTATLDGDNDFGNATTLTDGQTVNSQVNNAYDKYDYYKIDISGSRTDDIYLKATLTVNGGQTASVTLYDTEKRYVTSKYANNDYYNTGATVSATEKCKVLPGTYYIKIYTSVEEDVSYSLKAERIVHPSDGNDDLANATEVTLNETHTESMDADLDKYDCFKVDAQPSSDDKIKRYLVANVTSSTINDASIYIYNSTTNSYIAYGYDHLDSGVAAEASVWVQEAGTYYIKVKDSDGSGDMTLRTFYKDVVTDGNDDINVADPIGMDESITGEVNENTDKYDVYKIYMRHGDNLVADLKVDDATSDLDLYLYPPETTSLSSGSSVASSVTGHPDEQITYNVSTAGYYYIAVDAYSKSSTYTLSISGTGNHLPTVALMSPLNATTVTKEPVTLSWSGADSDGDTLEYTVMLGTSADNMTSEASGITDTTYSLSGLQDATTYYWTVIPNDGYIDGKCNSGIQVFTTKFNQPPTITSSSPDDTDLTIDEGDTLEFSISASDPDGDSIDIEWYLDGTKTSTKDTYTFTPSYTMGGTTYTIKVVVSDGKADVEKEWTVAVVDKNQPPILIIDSPANGTEFSIYDDIVLDASSSYDNDDPTSVTYSWSSNIDGSLGNDKTITTKLSAGEHIITLQAMDGHNTNITTIHLTVKAPVLSISEISSTKAQVGKKATVTVKVKNDGDVEAKQVRVKLYEGEKVIGEEVIDSIPAGGVQSVEFKWTPKTSGTKTMKAQASTGDDIIEEDTETVKVSKADEGSPGFEASVVLLSLAASVILVWRRRQ